MLYKNVNTSELKSMDALFSGCAQIKSLDLRSFDTSNVTSMYAMFKDCSSLEDLILSEKFITTNVESMEAMFYGCNIIETLDLTSFDMNNVIEIIAMLWRCNSLKKIYANNTFDSLGSFDKGDILSEDSECKFIVLNGDVETELDIW